MDNPKNNKKKQWKTGGEEDEFLHRLIKEGKIDKRTKPKYLKKYYPEIFSEFTGPVIRNHLNQAKRSNGLYSCDAEFTDDNELQNGSSCSNSNSYINNCLQLAHADSNSSTSLIHENYPIIIETYVDPVSSLEKVVLFVALPGGANNVEFDLNEEGTAVTISYSWPNTTFTMPDLFQKRIDEGTLTPKHPLILAINNGLNSVRDCIDSVPKAKINIPLPITVQTTSGSVIKNGVRRPDGTHLVYGELEGLSKNYNEKIKDNSIKYDM